jgi:hypothetical protein
VQVHRGTQYLYAFRNTHKMHTMGHDIEWGMVSQGGRMCAVSETLITKKRGINQEESDFTYNHYGSENWSKRILDATIWAMESLLQKKL